MKKSPSCSFSCSSSSTCSNDQSPLAPSLSFPSLSLPLTPQQQQQQQQSKAKRTRRTSLNPLRKTTTGNSTPSSSGKRSSIYRGVTRHRWTGRFEAHLWDKYSINNQKKKGKQVYLGAYDDEEAAAHTYDLAALKFWGAETYLNFPLKTYLKEFEEMQHVSREEYLASLRRRSSGFSRGLSKYRGVARHHHNGRWEARIGRVFGNKYLYLGTYGTQEEAAIAYDLAAIQYRGVNAVTNFDIGNYVRPQQQQQQNNSPPPQPETPPMPIPIPFQNLSMTFSDPQEMIGSSSHHVLTPDDLLEPAEVQSAAVVEPAMDYNSWNLCIHDNGFNPMPQSMDTGFNPLPFADNTVAEKSAEYLEFFNVHGGFEENIDDLFQEVQDTVDWNWNQYINETGGGSEEENNKSMSTTTTSTSTSSTVTTAAAPAEAETYPYSRSIVGEQKWL